jgi:hypothetical protein
LREQSAALLGNSSVEFWVHLASGLGHRTKNQRCMTRG